MQNIMNIVSNIVLYMAAYTFLAVLYGYAIYRIGRIIFSLSCDIYTKAKAAWNAWRDNLNH